MNGGCGGDAGGGPYDGGMSSRESKGKVLVAMSGGVDSSVAAALLAREGYEVVGCFMRLGSPGETLDSPIEFDERQLACDPTKVKIGHQGCCSINDAADARLVAAELGVAFYVVNFKKDFGRIIDYFVDEYVEGRTPNPCVRCNDWLKFGKLHEYAEQIGAEWVATGHYARVERDAAGRAALRRGLDLDKDQSYVLFGMKRARLEKTLLPIGGYRKADVRAMAKELGLPTFDKPDSQEICFVPDNDYAGLVERRRGGVISDQPAGVVLDPEGKKVGEHGGQHKFTIGQRRRVGVALGYPVFVVGKDVEKNTVTVGPREMLFARGLTAGEVNWLIDEPVSGEWRACSAKVRSNGKPAAARVRWDAERGEMEVEFDEPVEAVAPGQAVVVYEGERVMGGGWIRNASREAP